MITSALRPIVLAFSLAILASSALSAETPKVRTQAEFDRLFDQISNWGRWGADDERGALNLITPQKVREALALPREGISISLARDVEKEKAPDNGLPFSHHMDRTGFHNNGYSVADTYSVSYHGMAHTHLDSLCHMFYRGKMYNGFAATNVDEQGAHRLGIQNLKPGVVTRGVLFDIPRLKGVDYLEPGTAITPEDLKAWERKVAVHPGDIILVRTGRWARRKARGPWSGGYAGLHADCAGWLKAHDVAMLGSDAASDVLPSSVEGVSMPVHQLCLIAMGVWILDNLDLELVAQEAAKRERWDFLLMLGPLPVGGGTGSPLNPIAVF